MIYTDNAKTELNNRFVSGYVTGAGFPDDIARTASSVSTFETTPSFGRPFIGDVATSLDGDSHVRYHSALYAYATDDVTLANTVATEYLATVNGSDLNSVFWQQVKSDTAGGSHTAYTSVSNYWNQCGEIKKMMETYHLIKELQTILIPAEETQIETWFADYAFIVREWFDVWFDIYWGANWENIGLTKFSGEALYTETASSTAYPVEDVGGSPILDYVMTGAQNQFNNRIAEVVGFLHAWAIQTNDVNSEFVTRGWFKNLIKYGLFSDGAFCELWRNKNAFSINCLGVWYSWSTLCSCILMAHLDAMANNYPNDKLYDYTTTDGILNGSTNITTAGYLGSSTTDGTTEKSIKTFLEGQLKYYRTTANGGWNDTRYYYSTPLNMSAAGNSERDYSVVTAMANLYYKDDNLLDAYTYNQSVGYPVKNSFTDGYFNGEDGNIGTMILGAAWFEMEANFFQDERISKSSAKMKLLF